MNKAVLITGASTGIGYGAAVTLAQSGFRVFACVRNGKDQQMLQEKSSRITPILLDVTNPAQVQEAFDLVSSQSFDRFHLINNAGIAVVGPIETLPVAEFRRQFEVNFFGLIQVTQKFMILLRQTKGRIINISSISGLVSAPFLGAYSASKFAVEALSDSLRWELASSGVKVIVLEPGPIATPIWKKGFEMQEEIENAVSVEHGKYYGSSIGRFIRYIKKVEESAIPVERVSQAILKALTAKNPPTRMLVAGAVAKAQFVFNRFLPQKWFDRAIQKTLFK